MFCFVLEKFFPKVVDTSQKIGVDPKSSSYYLPNLLHPQVEGHPALSGPWAKVLLSGQQPYQESRQLLR